MSEHQRETAFLRTIIAFDDTDEQRKLEHKMTLAECNERCVKRLAAVMLLLSALGAAGLAYGAVLSDYFSYVNYRLVIEVSYVAILAALISLVVLVSHLMAYRNRLNRLREECRQLIMKLLESHPGKPTFSTSQTRPVSPAPDFARRATEFRGSLEPVATLRARMAHSVTRTTPGPNLPGN
jgi:hypothetical protein